MSTTPKTGCRGGITDDIVRAIRERAAAGETGLAIAMSLGLSKGSVRAIIRGDTHARIGGPIRGRPHRIGPVPTMEEILREAQQRIEARVEVDQFGCWLATLKPHPKGYVLLRYLGENFRAHRLAYMAYIGPVPDGLIVGHRCHDADKNCQDGDECRHRRCLNPAHLKLQTAHANCAVGRRGPALFRTSRCPNGHVYNEQSDFSSSCDYCAELAARHIEAVAAAVAASDREVQALAVS